MFHEKINIFVKQVNIANVAVVGALMNCEFFFIKF